MLVDAASWLNVVKSDIRVNSLTGTDTDDKIGKGAHS